VPEIKEYYINNTIPAASAMMHVTGDFNLSTLIRNSNFFGYEKVFYVGGKKHYDRRGTVGTHNYIDITFIKTEEEFVKTIKDQGYTLISIENNVNYECSNLFQFMDNVNVKDIKPIFIFGEEQKGLSDYILDNSEHILTISGKGTVRSLNVGTASGIVLGYYSKFF
jgi:tRNA G18 (ribose-2'-O)-methylase SpoU